MDLLQQCGSSIKAPTAISEIRLKELIERRERGDLCWLKHELARNQFESIGRPTDTVESRVAFNEETLIKEFLRGM